MSDPEITAAFEVAVGVLCALVTAVVGSVLATTMRNGHTIFLEIVLAALVIVQLFYLYQASRHQLIPSS